jgi:two-component system, OmpR family, response regulator
MAMVEPKRRVLCSEDNPDHRELISVMLSVEGFEAVCPEHWQDVIKMAKEEKFDLYLLDSCMPERSGIEICRMLRQFDPTTPIIFYSAAAFVSDREEAIAAGAQAYITKPTSSEIVIDTIRTVLSIS